MQPSARGNPQVPSPGSLRPFTPPDLSSIPHMDSTPPQNSGVRNSSSSVTGRTNDGIQEQSGPYIIGSPIDLGNIDNVDNIGLHIDSLATGHRRTREHIELQEAGAHETSSEGPAFWGLINPQWSLCSKGRRQSPINIEPDKLLFDRHLRPVLVDKHKVSGHLYNTGQFLVFRADREAKVRVNITGGPLAYHYQFEEIYIHYGMDNDHGSEHRINNYAFPAEIQVYGYNAELYHNMSEAQHKSQGLVAISLMVQLGETLNPELQIITSVFNKVIYRGDAAPVRHLSLKSLLPDTNGYMTYEGSTTHPGCWETAVWLILNKPIYVTARELYALRKLMQGPPTTPKAPLGNNSRPLQDLHYRTIRTNIDFRKRPDAKCPSMAQDMHYRANTWQDDGSLSHNVV